MVRNPNYRKIFKNFLGNSEQNPFLKDAEELTSSRKCQTCQNFFADAENTAFAKIQGRISAEHI
jgi:hypothetical protein